MDMTTAEWGVALGQVVFVVILAFVALCAATSFVRFQLMAEQAMEAEELGAGEERAFRLVVLNRIASARKARQPITVALLRLPHDGAPTAEIEAYLKARLRAGDMVMNCGNHTLGLLLACGSDQAIHPATRVTDQAIALNLAGAVHWRFGVAGYPEHGTKTSQLYTRAADCLADAETRRERAVGMADAAEVADDDTPPPNLADPVTGLIREEQMIPVMRKFIAQERREERRVAMAYLRIDQFDLLKTRHGAAECDRMLKELATVIETGLRARDLPARFGPDGFVVVITTSPEAALLAVQRLGQDVRKRAFTAGPGMKVSLSAGVAGYPDVLGTAVQYFIAAEAALKQAQTRGRSQYVVYDPSMPIASVGEKSVDAI
jgi:diguanylate cyclase (GGDEF)-like protein